MDAAMSEPTQPIKAMHTDDDGAAAAAKLSSAPAAMTNGSADAPLASEGPNSASAASTSAAEEERKVDGDGADSNRPSQATTPVINAANAPSPSSSMAPLALPLHAAPASAAIPLASDRDDSAASAALAALLLAQPDSPVTPALGSHPNPSHTHPPLSLDRAQSADRSQQRGVDGGGLVWKHSLFGGVDSPPSMPQSVLANSVLLDRDQSDTILARDRARGDSAETSLSVTTHANSAPAASLPADVRHLAMSPQGHAGAEMLYASGGVVGSATATSNNDVHAEVAAALAAHNASNKPQQRVSFSTPASPAVAPLSAPIDPPVASVSSSSASSASASGNVKRDRRSYPSDATFPFWIGSWNMGAKEMNHTPVAAALPSRSSIIHSGGGSARLLKVPPPADAPVLGAPTRSSSASVSVPSTAAQPHPNITNMLAAAAHGGGGAAAPPVSPFASWIAPGYKLYVIGLQESISESTYRALDAFFATAAFDCVRLQIPAVGKDGEAVAGSLGGTVKVEGRGDGSFLYPKCTSIAVWVARSARGLVSYCSSASVSMGLTQGSKGGACVALKILDATFVFMSVHLSSNTLAARRACYSLLVERSGNSLGERYFQLLEQFHHVFFLGDLNYRLAPIMAPAPAPQAQAQAAANASASATAGSAAQSASAGVLPQSPQLVAQHSQSPSQAQSQAQAPQQAPQSLVEIPISAADAVTYMQRGDLAGLLRFDELSSEIRLGHKSFGSFVEPPLDFYPTYKKHEGRRPVPWDRQAHPQWVHEVYKTIYKEPWYKTGKTASRIPSWCDRILWHSSADQRDRIQVRERHPFEPALAHSSSRRATAAAAALRIGGSGALCTYRSLENGLITSDHSAVSCGFQLILPCRVDWAARMAAAAASAETQGGSTMLLPPSPVHATGSAAGAASSSSSVPPSPLLSPSTSLSGLSPPLSRGPSNSFSTASAAGSPSAPAGAGSKVYIVHLLSVRVVPPLSPTLSLAVLAPSRNHLPPPFPVFHPRSAAASAAAAAAGPSSQAQVALQPLSRPASDATLFPGDLLAQCLEPKYVRVLFPAPFETLGLSLGACGGAAGASGATTMTHAQAVGVSKQVSFAPLPPGSNGSAAAAGPQRAMVAQPVAHPVHASSPQTRPASTSAAPSPRILPQTAAGEDVPPLAAAAAAAASGANDDPPSASPASSGASSAASSVASSPVLSHATLALPPGSAPAGSGSGSAPDSPVASASHLHQQQQQQQQQQPVALFGGLSIKAEFRCTVSAAEDAAYQRCAALQSAAAAAAAAAAASSSASVQRRSRSPSPAPPSAGSAAMESDAAAVPVVPVVAAAASTAGPAHGSLLALPSSSARRDSASSSSSSATAAGVDSAGADLDLPLPSPAPFHLLLKLHSSDDLSGQCCVALPRASFDAGETVECLEGLYRDGFPLCHPTSKQRIHVHFILGLSACRQ